jgi:hypothetical protein
MDLGISETQFAFTYLHHYLNLPTKRHIKFVLPTLGEEGNPTSPYAGADLVIAGHLYIQFKMPDYLVHWGAKEITSKKLPNSYKPYFRFNIKNAPTINGQGQYDLLVNRAKSSSSNIVKYVAPVFDNASHSPYSTSKSFWYHSFLTYSAKNALYGFITEVHVQDIISSRVLINANDDHRICYNFPDASSKTPAYVFSEEGRVRIHRGVSEYNDEQEDFIIPSQEGNTIESELKQLSDYTDVKPLIDNLNMSSMQLYLIRVYNIFWIPFGTVKITKYV